MNPDQVILFTLLLVVFAFLIWGRYRYDLVAFIALVCALVLGVVPEEQAFSGFGHPATIIIALVLIVSRGLSSSGAVELLAKQLGRFSASLQSHIAGMAGIGAATNQRMADMLEAHEDHMVFARKVLEQKAKADERFARRFAKIIEKHDKNLYGG